MATGRWLVAAGTLAVVVRVTYVVSQTRLDLFEVSFVAGDALLYIDIARNIGAGAGMTVDGQPTAYVMPGYPLFLALLFRLGLDPLGVGLAQATLGALTAVLVGVLALEVGTATGLRQSARPLVAALAALAAAIYPHLVFWTGYVITETFFVFLVAASLVTLMRALRTGRGTWAIGAGALASAAALTRPPYLAVAALLALWWGLRALRRKKRVVLPVLFAAAFAAPILGWTVRNAVDLGAPVVTSTESGFVFYQGNSRSSTGGSRGYVDEHDFAPLQRPAGLGEVEIDALYFRHAIQDIGADPLAMIRRWPAKIWNMWRPTYEGASVRNGLITLSTYLPVLVLGAAGAAVLARQGVLHPAIVPALVLVAWIAIHVAVTGMIRFRLSAELVLLATLPFGVRWLAGRLRRAELPAGRVAA